MIPRRAFLRLALALPLAACGEPQSRKRIGFLEAGSESANRHFVDAFRKGMRDLGYEDGRNIVIDVRWAEGRAEQFPAMLAELAKGKPDVIDLALLLQWQAKHPRAAGGGGDDDDDPTGGGGLLFRSA